MVLAARLIQETIRAMLFTRSSQDESAEYTMKPFPVANCARKEGRKTMAVRPCMVALELPVGIVTGKIFR